MLRGNAIFLLNYWYRYIDFPECPFRCKNEMCIPNDKVCDSQNDCGDNSDELKCSK